MSSQEEGMSPHMGMVVEFMRRAGQDTPERLTLPDPETLILRARLQLEETLELCNALGLIVYLKIPEGDSYALAEITEDDIGFEATGDVNLPEVLDAVADMRVIASGTLAAFGYRRDEALQMEVDKSNLAKFEEGAYRRDDGKWVKPPGFKGPNIVGLLKESE